MRRIQRDACHEDFVKSLTTGDLPLFREIWRVLLFAAALGIKNGRRRRLEKVESKTDKNTLLLEGLKQDIKTLAEVQTSFSEQLERTKNKDGKCLADMKK